MAATIGGSMKCCGRCGFGPEFTRMGPRCGTLSTCISFFDLGDLGTTLLPARYPLLATCCQLRDRSGEREQKALACFCAVNHGTPVPTQTSAQRIMSSAQRAPA